MHYTEQFMHAQLVVLLVCFRCTVLEAVCLDKTHLPKHKWSFKTSICTTIKKSITVQFGQKYKQYFK